MRVADHVKPFESGKPPATSGFHAELHSMWGPPPPMLKQASDFVTGVGEGFGNAMNEGAKAAAQAVTHPGETISNAAKETVDAVKTGLSATVAAGEYIGDHVARGDMNGVVHDAQKTGHVVGHLVSEGVNHLSKMNAHDLGKVVGHDVLPGAIAAVVAPELAGEGLAIAASAASKISTVVKEGAALEKVAGVYESATSRIEAISQKMAGLNKKMEALQHQEEQLSKSAIKHMGMPESAGFENLKPVRLEKSPVSDAFFEKVEQAKSRLEGWVGNHLERQGIEIHTVDKLENVFGARSARTPACFNPNDILSADGTEVLVKKGIYIAEHVWHDGNWQKNVDVLFQLHHEVGHAMCETLKTDWLSNDTAFGKLFSQCWKDADKANPTAIVLERLGTKEARCNEVFADLWSHLRFTPHGTNDYSRDMLKLFRPCFEYMQTKGEEWKAAAALSQKKL